VRPLRIADYSAYSCVGTLLLAHALMVAWLGARWSPNIDESAHLAAGLASWQHGTFEFYCVNPPLMRAVATLPILAMHPQQYWGEYRMAATVRPEFVLGSQLVDAHPDRWRTFLIASRWTLLPFSILGGLFCYVWANELFGRRAGVLALTLWCFSPNVLTWSAVVCTDGVATALGVGACYCFWRWLKAPSWSRALTTGIMLGLVQLSKMTWLPLFALWIALWLFQVLWLRRRALGRQQVAQMGAVLLLGLYVLNLGYAYNGSFTKLGDYGFHSRSLAGEGARSQDGVGNRFAGTFWGQLPIPLPKHYVRGLDLQRVDFEEGLESYMLGEWSDRGWWYYYLVGLTLKVPLGIWALAILAATISLISWRHSRRLKAVKKSREKAKLSSAWEQAVLLAPALMVVVLVSSQDGFSRNFRYVLPALPFAFIWISQSAAWICRDHWFGAIAVISCVTWTICSSLTVFPHSISYFNELAGGPLGGHCYMLHSSCGWSQDDFYLKRWLESHPDVDAPYTHLERSVSLERLGLRSRGAPPKSIPIGAKDEKFLDTQLGPVPGWHVISLQHIHEPDGGYLYFLEFCPIARAGYSANIYHITLAEANRVRRDMGLGELNQHSPSPKQVISDMAIAGNSSRRVRAVALSLGNGGDDTVGEIRNIVARDPGLDLALLTPDEIRAGNLELFDVLIVPGGSSSEQGASLGRDGRQAVRDFVDAGGGYVGICAGANLATTTYDWSLKLVNARTLTGARYVVGHGMQKASFRGWGQVQVELTNDGRRLFGDAPADVTMDYTGGPIVLPANEYPLQDYICLGYFRSEVWRYAFQKGTMVHSPAIVAARFGQGRIILFSTHPDTPKGPSLWLTRSIRACSQPDIEVGFGAPGGGP
jgi:putative intracellular protease/amidase